MKDFTTRLLERAKAKGFLPDLPRNLPLPLPAINKVELYLSYYGNDSCPHCITSSGPHRRDLMLPTVAEAAVKNIAAYSVLRPLGKLFPKGGISFHRPYRYEQLDSVPQPPASLNDELIQAYADSIMGKHCTAEWVHQNGRHPLNFGRPAIRISGGEFFTWPHKLAGKKVSEARRLKYQRQFLMAIRTHLPEYDIWILTNGRFATSRQTSHNVVSHWAEGTANASVNRGKTRIAVSVDPFHRPPQNSTREQMLARLWESSTKYLHCSPHIYSVTKRKLFLVGRALKHFECGTYSGQQFQQVSPSTLAAFDSLTVDPNNLVETDGCNELKGFICPTPAGDLLVNNIVINDRGNLAYCCVGVGDYGDFIGSPQNALKQMLRDPISLMLRKGSTAEAFLNLAVEMDSSLKAFGTSSSERTTGSVCYQVLSGQRVSN